MLVSNLFRRSKYMQSLDDVHVAIDLYWSVYLFSIYAHTHIHDVECGAEKAISYSGLETVL